MALTSACALTAVGVADDILTLSPAQKLALQTVVALGLILVGPPFLILNYPRLESVLVFVWLIGTTNAYNLIDGLDGLAGGIGAVTTVAVAATALLHHNIVLAQWSLALCGALCGFLVYNIHPATIFMGDAGALPVGLLLAVFALQAGGLSTNSRLINFVFPLLVMLVPILDMTIVSVARLTAGRPIFRRGLDHTHHRLLSLGLTCRSVVMAYWAVALLAALCAVGASVAPPSYLVVALPFVLLPAALVGLFAMGLHL